MLKKYWTESSSIAKLTVLIGLFVSAPVIVLPWFPENAKYAMSFLIPGGSSILIGLLLCFFGRKDADASMRWKSQIGRSSLTVLFAWSWGILIGAIPFILGDQLRVVQAFFESVSGWTTTGLSVMDVSVTPAIYLFHRSFMQYCGGMGFILMMIIFISNKHSANLYSAEGHPDKIMPNIKRTAQAIFIIYNICLVLGSVAYWLAGMTWFDSICHCMCALSTGGFSTKPMSIGDYNNLAIEIITIILMLLFATNFAALLVLAKGKIRTFFRVSEVKYMLILLAIFIPPAAISLAHEMNISLAEGFRISTFNLVSSMSTTGYSTINFADFPPLVLGLSIVIMTLGGGIGSTAGGIKIVRVYLMLRLCLRYIKKRIFPRSRVESSHYIKASGKMPIDQDLINDTAGFTITYLIICTVGSLTMCVTADCSLPEATFEFASALSNAGVSIGITGPHTNNATLILEMIGMLLGRLEIFIVIIGFTFGFGVLKSMFQRKPRNKLI